MKKKQKRLMEHEKKDCLSSDTHQQIACLRLSDEDDEEEDKKL
jgi:dolichyl-phosphate-mannose--protein O-mannosyl transferase